MFGGEKMETIKVQLENGNAKILQKNEEFYKVIEDLYQENIKNNNLPITLIRLNGQCHELTSKISEEGNIEIVRIDNNLAMSAYGRTLQFVFIKAALELFPNARITIEHSISKGIFGEIHKDKVLDTEDVIKIKDKMQHIINKDIKIEKVKVLREDAIKIFEGYGMRDKASRIVAMSFCEPRSW